MPNIRTYEAPNLGLQPTETGVSAAVQAGRVSERSYDQAASSVDRVASSTGSLGTDTARVGNEFARNLNSSIRDAGDVVVKYAEHKEISHGAAEYAQLNDTLTQQWNELAKNADPNDPSVAAKFRETVLEPALQKYQEGFSTEGGQKFAEARIDSLRNHMFEKTSADMSTLAASAVSVNMRTTANSLSNTASSDPSSVPHLLDSADGLVSDMIASAPNLKGAAAAKARMELSERMKEGIVKAGAIGAIAKASDPEAEAKRWGEAYPNYISGEELKMLSGNARQQIRAARTDAAYADHLQKVAAQDQSDKTETDYLKKVYSDDPQQQAQVSTKAIVNDPTLNRVAKERMITLVNREMKPETDARISSATSVQLFRKITDPNADPQEVRQAIYAARAKDPGTPGSITKSDFTDLMKNMEDIKTPAGQALAADRAEFFKKYAPTIDPSMGDIKSEQFGHHTALGLQKMYLADRDARRMESDLKAKGQDPHSLYDPASPNFFGRPGNLMKYQASMQAAAEYQAKMNKNLTGPGTTIAGVTVEDAPAFKAPPNWQFSASRQQYRDPDGKLYDMSGKPVK